MAIGHPSVLYAEGRCVGGSTVVNGGMSWRTPARVLRRWAEREGLQAITEMDLDPYFAAIESRLSVGPQDPETIGRDSELFKGGAEASGWTVVPNRRNQLHCAGTNNCNSGCPTGAKQSMLVTSVPAGAGTRGPAARRLPGGPDHPVRPHGDRRDRPLRPARRPQGPEPDRTGPVVIAAGGAVRPWPCSCGRACGRPPGSWAATYRCTRTRW